MSQTQFLNHNHRRNHNGRTYPELVKSSRLTEQETTYQAALELVAQIDENLTRGVRHYRTRAGLLLTTLDEVVRAILDNDLQLADEQETDVFWTPQELAA